jgi:hypothetical protein
MVNVGLDVTLDNETDLEIEHENAREASNKEQTEPESESVTLLTLLAGGNL